MLNEFWNGGEIPARYEIERSLKFDPADSPYLNRLATDSGSSVYKYTASWWMKIGGIGTDRTIVSFATNNFVNGWTKIHLRTDNTLAIFGDSTGTSLSVRPAMVFRDPSAWYHCCVSIDTTQSIYSDQIKFTINGVEQTNFDGTLPFAQNTALSIGEATTHHVGVEPNSIGDLRNYFDGYLADIQVIEGQVLAATDFAGYDDSNTWQPKDYTGTYGTNGFHLDFSDTSSDAALGTDSSGNGNNWTVNNLIAAGEVWNKDQMWSTYGTFTNTYGGSYDWPGVFNDGDEWDAYGSMYTDYAAKWILTSSIACSNTVKIYVRLDGSDCTFKINEGLSDETTIAVSGSGYQYLETSFSGNISNFQTAAPGNDGIYLMRIYVDGRALIDSNIAGPPIVVDALRDSPVNGDSADDTGAGGEITGNYATLNPLHMNPANTLGNGNLDITGASVASATIVPASIALPSSGKFYCEFTNTGGSTPIRYGIGIDDSGRRSFNTATSTLFGTNGGYYRPTGEIYDGSTTQTGSTYAVGDVISIAVDMSTGKFWFAKNGTWQLSGNPAAGTNEIGTLSGLVGNWFFGCAVFDTDRGVFNAGQRAFAYTAPSGYKALCTANLPDPTIADGSTAFDTKLWTGDTGVSTDITGYDFSPDFVWIKNRNGTEYNIVFDTVRGAAQYLYPNLTNGESDGGANTLTAFNSDGFTLYDPGGWQVNGSGKTYVGWAWEGGSSTVTNTDGDITSSVRANQAAGFSIVKWTSIAWTGSAANRQVGHGLNAAPSLIITKGMESVAGWYTYHKDVDATNPNDYYLTLNTTNARSSLADSFGPNIPDSTTFGDRSLGFSDGQEAIAYCFAPVEGYSAFGSYTGNGSADGPFVYTGFRPSWLLIKRTDSTAAWYLFDSKRLGYNPDNELLYPNYSNAEATVQTYDLLSNGFKVRTVGTVNNASGGTYIWAAFAEHPFKTARAR